MSASDTVRTLLTASSTGNNNITINITGDASTTYHLYMTDNPHAQASTSTPLPDNNIHNLTLDPAKTYYFILGEVGTNGKERPAGAYVTSKPSANGQYRENIVINPPTNTESKQSNQTLPTNNALGLNPYLNLTGGSYLSVYYDDWATGSVHESLHISEPTGGHFVKSNVGANLLGNMGGHPEVKSVTDTSGNPVWIWAYRPRDANSPVAGKWDTDDDEDRYLNRHANGEFQISLIYSAISEPYFSFWGKPTFDYRIRVCSEIVAEGSIPLKAGLDLGGTAYITPPITVSAPSFCPGDTPPDRTLSSILVEPPKATIYIHPRNPASASQQYKATGTYNDSTTEDITTKAQWHSKTNVATIGMTGLATIPQPIATAKPGSTAIWATVTIPTNPPFDLPSNGAELCVECWEYAHYRQNAREYNSWADDPYAYRILNSQATVTVKIGKKTYVIKSNSISTSAIGQNGKPVPRTTADLGTLKTGFYTGYPYSIGGKGCHMVVAAMILTVSTGQPVDPRTLNDWLRDVNNREGYDKANGPRWDIIETYPNANIVADPNETTYDQSTLDQILQDCDAVVVKVVNNKLTNSHYVLMFKGEKGKYKIYDPWIYRDDNGKILDNLVQQDDLNINNTGTHDYTIKAYRKIHITKK